MNVTIRNVDARAFQALKARAALQRMRLGEAVSEAARQWAEAPATAPTEKADWERFHRAYRRLHSEGQGTPPPGDAAKSAKLAKALAGLRTRGPRDERLSEGIDQMLYGA